MPLHGNQEASLGRFNGFDDAVVGFSRYTQLRRDGLDGLMVEAVDLDIRLVDQLREPRVRIEPDPVDKGISRTAVGVRMFDGRHALESEILPEAAA